MTAEVSARTSPPAQALARVAKDHQLIARTATVPRSGCWPCRPRPTGRRALSAGHPGRPDQGMIGYMLEQELGNLLPLEVPLATILTMVEVDPDDPAFGDPTKFVGPVYDEAPPRPWPPRRAGRQARWRPLAPGGALAAPAAHLRAAAMKWLLEQGVLVICAGGGGIPTMYARGENRHLVGVEAVIDKDLAGEPAGARPGGRPVRDGHRCRRRLHRTGERPSSAGWTQVTTAELKAHASRPARWAPRSRPRSSS